MSRNFTTPLATILETYPVDKQKSTYGGRLSDAEDYRPLTRIIRNWQRFKRYSWQRSVCQVDLQHTESITWSPLIDALYNEWANEFASHHTNRFHNWKVGIKLKQYLKSHKTIKKYMITIEK